MNIRINYKRICCVQTLMQNQSIGSCSTAEITGYSPVFSEPPSQNHPLDAYIRPDKSKVYLNLLRTGHYHLKAAYFNLSVTKKPHKSFKSNGNGSNY